MAKYRNISADTFTEVRVGGDVVATNVAPEGLVDVPDALAALAVWPESVWSVVADVKSPAPAAPSTNKNEE